MCVDIRKLYGSEVSDDLGNIRIGRCTFNHRLVSREMKTSIEPARWRRFQSTEATASQYASASASRYCLAENIGFAATVPADRADRTAGGSVGTKMRGEAMTNLVHRAMRKPFCVSLRGM
jgi:hypothetical protein